MGKQLSEPRKFSLHFGLNHVDPGVYGGWDGELKGCQNDARSMEKVFAERGFEVRGLYFDSEATTGRLAFHLLELSKIAKRGDLVVFTYSGHGGRVADETSDETDKRDETLCLFDGELLDDDFERMLAILPSGVRFVFLSDSCHSATNARSASTRRDANDPKLIKSRPDSVAPAVVRFPVHKVAGKPTRKPKLRCEMISISGCLDSEYSFDGKENGAFTAAVLEALKQLTPKARWCDLHYLVLEICKKNRPAQHPALTVYKGARFTNRKIFT